MMLGKLPGPYALLGWLAAGALMLLDGLIWSELGATLPGSGGSYLYLLESYGRERWGRLMAFLFVWQFLISGPLEIASGLIVMAGFATDLSDGFKAFDESWKIVLSILNTGLAVEIGPARLFAFAVGVLILILVYRRITSLGKLTVTIWLGVLFVIGWILVAGFARFDAAVVFDFSGKAADRPADFWSGLGAAMILAMYSYLGYYNICYLGDEVRDPGRTIPRAVLISSLLVCALFVGLHLAMLGTVSWHDVPVPKEGDAGTPFNLPAEFMRRTYGESAAVLVTLFLIWSCFGAAFAGLLGYSRIPYGAARYGHFFAPMARVHPVHHIPHVSLLVVGALTLFWIFFDLATVITALLTTRILDQFIGQTIGVMLLRRAQPDRPRPFRIWLYPLPCLLALAGWLYIYCSAGAMFIALGLVTLVAGALVCFVWSRKES